MSLLSFYHYIYYRTYMKFHLFSLLNVIYIIWHVSPWHASDSTATARHVWDLLRVLYLPAKQCVSSVTDHEVATRNRSESPVITSFAWLCEVLMDGAMLNVEHQRTQLELYSAWHRQQVDCFRRGDACDRGSASHRLYDISVVWHLRGSGEIGGFFEVGTRRARGSDYSLGSGSLWLADVRWVCVRTQPIAVVRLDRIALYSVKQHYVTPTESTMSSAQDIRHFFMSTPTHFSKPTYAHVDE